jgi:triphosphatase
MHDPVETEFKLRATGPLEVAAVDACLRTLANVRESSSRRHVDTYFDDARGSLRAAGIGLRLRRGEGDSLLCCKGSARIVDGRFERHELELPWPHAHLPQQASELPPELADRVEPFTRLGALLPFLELTTWRDVRLVAHAGHDVCELVVDQVTASADGRSATFAEIELEVLDDLATTEQLATALRQRLPLQAADHDKPTHATLLLGLPQPVPPGAWTADTPLGEALRGIVAAHGAMLRTAEAEVRAGDGSAALHTLRVAIRRLRSLVRSCREAWQAEPAERALRSLAELGRTCGECRDHDVMLELVAEGCSRLPAKLRPAGEAALLAMSGQRDTTAATLRQQLRTTDHQRQLEALFRDLEAIADDEPGAATPLGTALPHHFAPATARVRKLLEKLPPELPLAAVHELRLAVKRLRYLAEEFVELPGHDFARALARLAAVQQTLGSICDAEAAAERLAHAANTADRAEAAAALGALAMWQHHRAARARAAAEKALAKADRKKVWRRFPAPPTDAPS